MYYPIDVIYGISESLELAASILGCELYSNIPLDIPTVYFTGVTHQNGICLAV